MNSTSPGNPDIPNTDHLARFGSIVVSFARLEHVIQTAMAAVAGVDDEMKIVVLTRSLTYSQKRDTLYSYFKLYSTATETQQEIRNLIDKADKHYPLRNHIAHALWFPGTRPGTIRPAYVNVRGGKGRIAGLNEDDRDYSMDELGDAANELRAIVNNLIRYLRSSGQAHKKASPRR